MTYMQLAKWDEVYENNRTRDLKRMEWVPIPNRMDGDGYTELVDHENGAEHLGAWIAIIQIASKCEERGTLMRDGASPHTSMSLSRISRLPQCVFDEVIPRLIKIGWIEVIIEENQQLNTEAHNSAGLPHLIADECLWNGMERNGMEGKGNVRSKRAPKTLIDPFVSERQKTCFDEFWGEYWRKVDKKAAEISYVKHVTTEKLHTSVMVGVRLQKAEMLARDPEKRPHGSTWLNHHRWNDQPNALPRSVPQSPYETPEQMRDREAREQVSDEAARAKRRETKATRKETSA